MTDLYEAYNDQKTGKERLVQFHTRFRRSTFAQIQGLSDDYNTSKAEIVRKLVQEQLGDSPEHSRERV